MMLVKPSLVIHENPTDTHGHEPSRTKVLSSTDILVLLPRVWLTTIFPGGKIPETSFATPILSINKQIGKVEEKDYSVSPHIIAELVF